MLKNYLKIAFRNLIKHKRFSFINILGLAIGLACFILITLWVQDELSYDTFYENADNIYLSLRGENGKLGGVTSQSLAPALREEVPEVVDATTCIELPKIMKSYLKKENIGFEQDLVLADTLFFNVFSFKFKAGDPNTAVVDQNSIVLTEHLAKKLFGEQNAVGESLELTILGTTNSLKVTGVLENIPHNSHIQCEAFIPISYVAQIVANNGIQNWANWGNHGAHTYILTRSNVNIAELEQKIVDCERSHQPNSKLENLQYSLLPLKRIHLHATQIEYFTATGDIKYVYIFSVIAGIILLIACMNYMNLSNAFSLRRTKEIGIQKVVGAFRSDLIWKFLGETVILTLLAFGVALLFAELFLPVFNQLAQKSLSISYLNPQFWGIMLLTIFLTSIISGLYPAFFVSGFQPIQVLKGKFHAGSKGSTLKKSLVVFQFALSIIIILCTITVFNQLNFIQNSKLGYDKENVVCLRVKGDIHDRYDAFKNSVLQDPDFISLTRCEAMEKSSLGSTGDIHWSGRDVKDFGIYMIHCDNDYAATFKIKMNEGRFYSGQFPTDKTSGFVLNQAAVDAMGLESPIGTEMSLWGRKGTIIGVTEDFHYGSFHHKIDPLVFRIPDDAQKKLFYREISVRLKPNSIRQSLAALEKQWKTFFPNEPFDFYFWDENLNASYWSEQRVGDIFKYFSFLAIFIACLGLYGLTAFMIEQKIKDIGVYKTLGASVSNIVVLLSKSYVWWILFANLIAWPIAYLAMNKWLEDFAYRIEMSWWMFALAGGMALLIALGTVSWQAVRAAQTNPVEALRYE